MALNKDLISAVKHCIECQISILRDPDEDLSPGKVISLVDDNLNELNETLNFLLDYGN